TRALALPFIGVDYAGTRTLERLGIETVLRDFSDAAAFLRALDAARPPTTPIPSRRPAAGARRRASGPRPPSRPGSRDRAASPRRAGSGPRSQAGAAGERRWAPRRPAGAVARAARGGDDPPP